MECLIIDVVHSSIPRKPGKYMQIGTHIPPPQQELAKLIPDYDALVMRVNPAINKEILDVTKNLKVIGTCSVGLNHVDLETVKIEGTQVLNAPGLNANAVAELTLSKMPDIARHTIPADTDVKVDKNWNKYKFVGSELRDETLGILGFGRVGRCVDELGRTFLMSVVAYGPFLKPEDFEKENVKDIDINELLKASDHTSIHVPPILDTKNLFNVGPIVEVKPNTVVLSTSRGDTVNEQDVYEAPKANKIGGYATDVMENELTAGGLGESAFFDPSLFECGNFIITSHLSAQSLDVSRDTGILITAKLKETLDLN